MHWKEQIREDVLMSAGRNLPEPRRVEDVQSAVRMIYAAGAILMSGHQGFQCSNIELAEIMSAAGTAAFEAAHKACAKIRGLRN